MSRRISFYTVKGGGLIWLDALIEYATEGMYKRSRTNDGLSVSGCGMDMGFAVVYDLSCVLYGRKDSAGYILSNEWL